MRDIALSLFIFACIPFILVRPYFGVLVWSWLGYMNPHRLTWGFAYSFPWVELIAVVTLVSLFLSKERRSFPWSGITALLLIFLAWTAVCTPFAFAGAAALSKFEEFAKIQVMVMATLLLIRGRQRIQWLIWVIAFSIGFYGIKGGLFVLATGGSSHVLGPPASFITDNNALALALCMVLPLMRYLQMQDARKWMRVGIGVCMALTVLAIFATYSRGGLLGLAAVGAFLIMKSRRRLVFTIALLVTVPILVSLMPQKWTARMHTIDNYQDQSSAISRIHSWEFAFNVAVARPLVGGGFEVAADKPTFWRYAPRGAWRQRAIHSIFFRVLGEQGFVGLALFVSLLLAGWRAGVRIRKMTRGREELKWAYDLASMLQVSLVAYVLSGALLPMTYFDLTYQLLGIFVLVGLEVNKAVAVEQKAVGNVYTRHEQSALTGRLG